MKTITPCLLAACWRCLAGLACLTQAMQATVTLNSNDAFVVAGSPTGDLTITGDLSVMNGIDFGTTSTTPKLAAVQLNYFSGTTNTAMSDITAALGTFQWRDNLAATARNKLKLDGNNVLTLYKSDGSNSGILLNPNTSNIYLSETGGGIYAGTTPVFTVDATGQLVFGNRPFNLPNTTAATSSATGALTVSGGLGVALDGFFNGVRVGRGPGNIPNNTVLGADIMGANQSTGSCNTAVGGSALRFNTTGNYNTALGFQSMFFNTTGSSNIAIGQYALLFNTTGTGNIAIGKYAAATAANATNSIYIGNNTCGPNIGDNSIVIGNNAVSEGPNTTVIGNPSTILTHIYGSTLQIGAALKLSSTTDGSVALGGYACGAYSFSACGQASGDYTVALAGGQALGKGAVAISGQNQSCAAAKGSATIGGYSNVAIGECAYAMGNQVVAKSAYSIVLGSRNKARKFLSSWREFYGWLCQQGPAIATDWNEESTLFELGNGNPFIGNTDWNGYGEPPPFDTSNAITTLKNGRTTLTNKAWLANSSKPLADPAPTTDSGGEALVVEGHTRLKGKVIIEQAQGDISMGIYGH